MIFGTPLDSYLDPGEKLLWSGQPKQGVRLKSTDAIMIPASLAWGGFAFFWEASVLGLTPLTSHSHLSATGGTPLFMALWGIPFCLIGLQFIFGRFFTDAYSRRKTWYGVTDKRVLVLKSGLFGGTSVNSFDYANLTNLNLAERKDNSGDILLGLPFPMGSYTAQPRQTSLVPGFYLLPQARSVYNLIREAQSKARK